MGSTCGGDHLHSVIAPNAVVDMNHQIAGAEALGFGQEILGPTFAFRGADQPVPQHVLL